MPDLAGRPPGLTGGRLAVVVVLVCGGSTAVSAYLGALATYFYGSLSERIASATVYTAVIGGGLLGLAAGILWCVKMSRLAGRDVDARELITKGVSWGVLFGLAASFLLHSALLIVARGDSDGLAGMLAGIPFALAAGAGLGLLGGVLVAILRRPPVPPVVGPAGSK